MTATPALAPLDRGALRRAAYQATNRPATHARRLGRTELAAVLYLQEDEVDDQGRLRAPQSWEALVAKVADFTGHVDRTMGRAFGRLRELGWIVCDAADLFERLQVPQDEIALSRRAPAPEGALRRIVRLPGLPTGGAA